jgi:hypothetical protein
MGRNRFGHLSRRGDPCISRHTLLAECEDFQCLELLGDVAYRETLTGLKE